MAFSHGGGQGISAVPGPYCCDQCHKIYAKQENVVHTKYLRPRQQILRLRSNLDEVFITQARKRHININSFVQLVLGRPRVCPGDFTGFVPGTNPVKTWDEPGFSRLFYTVEARFHRACPWDKPGLSLGQSRGRRAAQKVYVKKVHVPFSLANHMCIGAEGICPNQQQYESAATGHFRIYVRCSGN